MEAKQVEAQQQQQQQENAVKLKRNFTFFFMSPKANMQERNWDDLMQKVGSFNTVDDFWAYYQHMQRPENFPENSQFCLFQEDITPSWEHGSNQNGGRYQLRIKKKYANRVWEDLVLSFIGEQCDEADSVTGLQLHAKDQIIQIYIWVRDLKNSSQKEKAIRKWITDTLGLSENVTL